MKKQGSRLAVYRGKALKTTGGLTKSMLSKSKFGKIVSKKKQQQAKQKSNLKGFLQGKKARKLHKKESKVSVPVPKAKQQAPKLFKKQSRISVPIPKPKPRKAPKSSILPWLLDSSILLCTISKCVAASSSVHTFEISTIGGHHSTVTATQ